MENTELILKAVNYAKQNATNNLISVEDVAKNAGFSIDYFNRIFLAHTGFTVTAYISYIRLKHGAFLLRKTEKSVLDIALEIGYDSHEGFTKAFKKKYGVSPSEYRSKNKNKMMYLGEIADKTVTYRFIHDNPDFQLINSDEVIDYLLEKNAKRYCYFCSTIKYQGLEIVASNGDYEKGIVAVGDDGNGGSYLEIATDDYKLLADWINRFPQRKTFYSDKDESEVRKALKAYNVSENLKVTPQTLYFGDTIKCEIPDNITIRPLTIKDRNSIIKWANGRKDSYIIHLLNEQDYLDENNLEYGIFEKDKLIAVAGCGIDEVHGMRINNCCAIRFNDVKESNKLYREIFAFVTNDIMKKGALPFDDLQHGEYAKTHGDFTSIDLGYEIVNKRYDIL